MLKLFDCAAWAIQGERQMCNLNKKGKIPPCRSQKIPNDLLLGAFINDVTQILTIFQTPLPPLSRTYAPSLKPFWHKTLYPLPLFAWRYLWMLPKQQSLGVSVCNLFSSLHNSILNQTDCIISDVGKKCSWAVWIHSNPR